MKELITGARIVNRGKITEGYLLLDNEIIAEVGAGDAPEALCRTADKITDLEGAWLMPGVIDTHVHFRDGGDASSPKGNFETESRAALAGGVTTVFDMPNTSPATVTVENLKIKQRHAAECSAVNYAFFLGATNSNLQELISADYTAIPGVKIFMGASTGNMLVEDKSAISEIFAEVDAVKAVHAESQPMLEANLKALKSKYAGDEIPVSEHPAWRSEQVCVTSTAQAIELAEKTNSRLHVCHISTAAEAAMFKPGSPACKRITAETCPQYLIFGGAEDYQRLGSRIKCNPAIKTKNDAKKLLKALIDGRIDTVATDHAPHLPADKEGFLTKAASGMPGIQFSLRLMLELSFANPELTIERVVELMAHNPATVFGIEKRGYIEPGMFADLVAVRRTEPYRIEDSDVVSKCGWTPYAGMILSTEIIKTWVNGTSGKAAAVTFSPMK